MLSQGLSHIILNASNYDDYGNALKFYQAIGFGAITDKPTQSEYVENEEEKRIAWLELSAEAEVTTDMIIKLVLNPSSLASRKFSADIDLSLEETAIVFATNDIKVSFKNNRSNR